MEHRHLGSHDVYLSGPDLRGDAGIRREHNFVARNIRADTGDGEGGGTAAKERGKFPAPCQMHPIAFALDLATGRQLHDLSTQAAARQHRHARAVNGGGVGGRSHVREIDDGCHAHRQATHPDFA